MAGDTVLTVIGNLTDSPELRFTPAGAAVANFTVASTPRVFDRNVNEWKDGEALFLRCNIWREAAENVAASLVIWSPEDEKALKQLLSDVDMSITSKEA